MTKVMLEFLALFSGTFLLKILQLAFSQNFTVFAGERVGPLIAASLIVSENRNYIRVYIDNTESLSIFSCLCYILFLNKTSDLVYPNSISTFCSVLFCFFLADSFCASQAEEQQHPTG